MTPPLRGSRAGPVETEWDFRAEAWGVDEAKRKGRGGRVGKSAEEEKK